MRCRRMLPRSPLASAGLLLSLLVASSCLDSSEKASAERLLRADTVLLNGRIITVDAADTIAEALAIRDGKILAVGKNTAVRQLAASGTQVIDLQGSTATPGLIDAHCHFVAGGVGMLYILDLSFPVVRNIADVVGKVQQKVQTLEPGQWISGRGWDEGKLEELRYIYAKDLDPVAPQNPVWLMHTMGHYGTANSAALKLAGITNRTPDPPGGSVDRYPDGSPTGVLKENAMDLVLRLMPARTSEQMQEGIIELVRGFNSEGMTAAKEPGIGLQAWEAYQSVLARKKLGVRIFVLWDGGRNLAHARELVQRVGPFTKPYLSTGDDRLISGGVKLYIDGSGGARTAWMYEEWSKNFRETDKGNYGYPIADPQVLREMIRLYHGAGLHIGAHAIGDRAIDWLLDSYGLAFKDKPIQGLRHSVIHCNLPTERALGMMAEMQKAYDAAYPEAEAVHLWWIGDTYAGNFGPERCLRLKPYKTFLNRGIRWAATSDFYVDPFPARYGIWAQIAREPLLGVYGKHPFGAEESVDVRSALRAYTIWSAQQLFLEKKIGSLEPGKYADIAVWDKDLYTIATEELKDLKCQLTLLEGELVYRAQDSRVTVTAPAQQAGE